MSHQDRREPLPKGYQFGDAGKRESSDYDFLVEAMENARIKIGPPVFVVLNPNARIRVMT